MKKICLIIAVNLYLILPALAQNPDYFIELANQNIEKYRKADFTIQLENFNIKNKENITLEVEQISHDFLFGCIIFDLVNSGRKPENEELFKARFKQLFNFAILPFYWAGYETVQGNTQQNNILEVARWCRQNGITTKGHPLVWTHTAGTPAWLKNYSTPETKELLQTRVEKIVAGFKGDIEIWDVLNEAIHTVNWDVAMKENEMGQDFRYVNKNFMSDQPTFIDSCFRWANRANPQAELILNEFDIVANPISRKRFYELLTALNKYQTPLSGIGIQAHEPDKGRYYYSPKQIWETFETYAEFDIPMHLTELIVVANGDSITGGYLQGVWDEQKQAGFAEMIYTLGFGFPGVKSINWWGFSDKNIWQEKGGLVDENLNAKPVFNTLDSLINHKWKTKISGLKPDKNGVISFRGFKGNYNISILKNGELSKKQTVSNKNAKIQL